MIPGSLVTRDVTWILALSTESRLFLKYLNILCVVEDGDDRIFIDVNDDSEVGGIIVEKSYDVVDYF